MLVIGCASTPEKERILKEGSFFDKVSYLERSYSIKDEVVEFLGPPDRTENFHGGGSIWFYHKNAEKPLEIVFGRGGSLMRIGIRSEVNY